MCHCYTFTTAATVARSAPTNCLTISTFCHAIPLTNGHFWSTGANLERASIWHRLCAVTFNLQAASQDLPISSFIPGHTYLIHLVPEMMLLFIYAALTSQSWWCWY